MKAVAAHDHDPGVDPFRTDVLERGGYRYTTDAPLSSRLANERLTLATLEVADFAGTRMLDIGCGDGTYTLELARRGLVLEAAGLDPAPEAIEAARRRDPQDDVSFRCAGAYELPFEAASFDLAYLRGVLHHMEHPLQALREALRVARRIVVVEPNGHSPALKLLERLSPYHREHGERSYPPGALDRWVAEAGGVVDRRTWAGLVPMFCPELPAAALKRIEPAFERTLLLNRFACAVYVFSARRDAD